MSEKQSGDRQQSGQSLMMGAHSALRARRDAADALPHPQEEWIRSDIPPVLDETLQKFRNLGIVEVVGSGRMNCYRYNIYRTTTAAHEYVEALGDPGTPCSHTGVRNLGDGQYTCSNGRCDIRFGEEVAQEALLGGE